MLTLPISHVCADNSTRACIDKGHCAYCEECGEEFPAGDGCPKHSYCDGHNLEAEVQWHDLVKRFGPNAPNKSRVRAGEGEKAWSKGLAGKGKKSRKR